VAAGVFGIAGAGSAGHRRATELAAHAWTEAGMAGTPEVVTDLDAAFAGATAQRSGSLLLVGTGAVAARFERGRLVRRCDGLGWFLGDEGSGFWLGRAALTAVLAWLDGRGSPTALTGPVLGAVLGGAPADYTAATGRTARAELVQQVIAAAYPPDPPRIAALAPCVDAAARSGDPVAEAIARKATAALLHSLSTAESAEFAASSGSSAHVAGPVVLAGSLLVHDTTVARGVISTLAHRQFAVTRDAALGAAGLALRRIGRARLHASLISRT
jgi:N-acetylglucosamine kinase-like BadF-type ATPase